MRFMYGEDLFEIEFQRTKRQRALGGPKTFPDTTVRLLRYKPDGQFSEIYREATVGCSIYDKFTLEGGRLAALRAISRTLGKDFKRTMWSTYLNRKLVV